MTKPDRGAAGTTDLETATGKANAAPGPRSVPSRVIPVPTTVSPQMRETIASPYSTPAWNLSPADNDEWREAAARPAEPTLRVPSGESRVRCRAVPAVPCG
jgi:hypothetical protein